MDLLYLDFSKMEDGNMLLLTQEFHLILKLKLHFMDTAQKQMSSGFLWWKKPTQSFMEATKNFMEDKWTKLL